MKIEVRECEMIPKGYGIAYYCYDRLSAICYPIPINFLISLCYTVYLVLKRGITPRSREAELRKAYDRGFNAGRWSAMWEKL